MRRRFYERFVADASPIAAEALQRIALIYAVEKDIRGRSPDQRRAARQERSRPVVVELEPWLRAKLPLLSQKSKLAEAIRYALSRWEGLSRFLDDGRIEIDSNTVERSIRPIAMRVSLYAPSSSICKHWKRDRVGNATWATFSGHRGFGCLRRQVGSADLVRSSANNLHSRKNACFDQASYRMVREA